MPAQPPLTSGKFPAAKLLFAMPSMAAAPRRRRRRTRNQSGNRTDHFNGHLNFTAPHRAPGTRRVTRTPVPVAPVDVEEQQLRAGLRDASGRDGGDDERAPDRCSTRYEREPTTGDGRLHRSRLKKLCGATSPSSVDGERSLDSRPYVSAAVVASRERLLGGFVCPTNKRHGHPREARTTNGVTHSAGVRAQNANEFHERNRETESNGVVPKLKRFKFAAIFQRQNRSGDFNRCTNLKYGFSS